MASTYSPSLRLELMATGDQSGTWGDTTNTNLGTLLEQAITGYLSKAMADTDQTLTNLNGASDEARNMVLNLTGALTAGRNVVVPTANKVYLVRNSTTGNFAVTVKTSAGTGVAVYPGQTRWVACDGTNVVDYAVPKFLDSQFLLADDADVTKLAAFQLSGLTTGTTRTYTLVDRSGTLLLSGGTLDTQFILQDDGDTTKQAQFDVSGLSAATTRTYTFPNQSGALALSPSVTTDNAATRFDGTTGLLQNSAFIIADSGESSVSGAGATTNVGHTVLNTTQSWTFGLRGDSTQAYALTNNTGGYIQWRVIPDAGDQLSLPGATANPFRRISNGSRSWDLQVRGDTSNVLAIIDQTAARFVAAFDTIGNTFAGGKTSVSGSFPGSMLGLGTSTNYNEFVSTNAGGTLAIEYLNRASSDGIISAFRRNGTDVGSISVTTSATTYNTSSDYRLPWKSGAVEVSGSGDFIDALKPKFFPEVGHAGFIAHEFAEVSPSSVTGEKDAINEFGAPVYQAMQASTPDVIANIVAELQSLRKRLKDAGL